MQNKDDRSRDAAELRRRAEALARENAAQAPENLEALAPADARQTLHELQVHQIELELQNEELRRAQEELDAARARYFDLYDLAPVGYVTLSAAGLILEANLTATTLLGVARGALAKRLLSKFILKEDQGLYYRCRRQLAARGTPQACELRLVRQDGTQFWAYLAATAALAADGAPVFRVVLSDISARKQAEETRGEAERFAQATVDALATQLAILDEHGNIITVNRAWREFGRANAAGSAALSEGVNYLTVCDAAHGPNSAEAAAFAAGLRAVLHGAQAEFTLEYPCHSPTEQRWFIGRVTRFPGQDVRRLIVAHENITERVQLEMAQQEALYRLRKIASRVPGVVYQYRLRPDGSSCFPFASEAINEIYRVSPDEVREDASKVFANLHPDDYAGVVASIQASAKDLAPWHHEYRVKFDDGVIRTLYGNAVPQGGEDGSVLWHGFITDITERKQVEAALDDIRWRQASIIEGTRAGTWEWNVQTGAVILNERWAQIVGYTLAELAPVSHATWEALVHPADRPQSAALLARHFAGKLPDYDYECRMRHKDGHWVWVQDRGRVITRTDDGQPLLMFGTHTDITARKQLEAALRMQHDLSLALNASVDLHPVLELILEAALQLEGLDCGGIYVTDPTGALDLVVHRGLAPQFIAQATYYPAAASQASLAHAGQTHYGTYRSIRPEPSAAEDPEGLRGLAAIPVIYQGQLLALLNLASHTHDDIPGLTRQALEILAQQIGSTLLRLRVAAALRESQQNLQTLFDSVDDFLFVLDGTGQILQVNAVTLNRLGYTSAELVGQDVLLVHPPDRRVEAAAIIAAMLAGQRDTCLVPLQAKDGTLILVETRVTPGTWGGRPALFGLARDITARLRAEQHAFELALERERMALLGKFIQDVSHEFRTPLTIIQTNAYLLERFTDPVKRQRKLAVIDQQIAGLTRLVDQLAELARLDSSVPFTMAPTDLNELVAEAVAKLQTQAATNGVTLQLALAPDLPPLPAAADRLLTALRALVGNAVRYTPAGGHVTVRSARTAAGVAVEVADTGPGMAPDVLAHIFERFYRQDEAHSTPGFGLGLPIARAIIERHSGRLEVASQPGVGSTFRINLPA